MSETQKNKRKVATVSLNNGRSTSVSFKKLHTWVIWQFPRPKDSGLCGAVHPPIADHGWFPAVINPKEQKVQILGHTGEPFATPEAAIEYLKGKKRDEG